MLNEIAHTFKSVDTLPVNGVVNTPPVGFILVELFEK